jgi:copper(I)-binding protein
MTAGLRRWVLGTALGISGAGALLTGLFAQDTGVVARDAWVRMPAPSKNEAALYLVVENHTSEKRKIVSVSTDAAAQAEMHQMRMERMTMVMTPISEIAISAKGKTSLNPNNLHIMLFGLKSRPAIGDVINVKLKLDDGGTVPVMATVRK